MKSAKEFAKGIVVIAGFVILLVFVLRDVTYMTIWPKRWLASPGLSKLKNKNMLTKRTSYESMEELSLYS